MWKVRWKINHGLAVGLEQVVPLYYSIILRLYDNFIMGKAR